LLGGHVEAAFCPEETENIQRMEWYSTVPPADGRGDAAPSRRRGVPSQGGTLAGGPRAQSSQLTAHSWAAHTSHDAFEILRQGVRVAVEGGGFLG
jgi:hypothetical protein